MTGSLTTDRQRRRSDFVVSKITTKLHPTGVRFNTLFHAHKTPTRDFGNLLIIVDRRQCTIQTSLIYAVTVHVFYYHTRRKLSPDVSAESHFALFFGPLMLASALHKRRNENGDWHAEAYGQFEKKNGRVAEFDCFCSNWRRMLTLLHTFSMLSITSQTLALST